MAGGSLSWPLLILLLGTASSAQGSSFTIPLYGEKLRGFVKVENIKDDSFILSFSLDEAPSDARLSLHQAAMPYDSAVLTDNCHRARKSPHVFRDRPIQETTVDGKSLIGHTIVLGNIDEVYACTTVIVDTVPLLYAFFHADSIQGPIHIIPMASSVRLLPDLKYPSNFDGTLGNEIIDWAFVEKCDSQNAFQNSVGMELGVDSRATLTIETSGVNVTLKHFELFKNGKSFACAPIVSVQARRLKSGDIVLSQPHAFEAVKALGEALTRDELHVRDDCLDVATETIHQRFHDFFPSLSIFGPETILLKSLVDGNGCVVLRPQFPLYSAMADVSHPVAGRIVFVDTDERIVVTGNLRNLMDDQTARATVQISPKFTPASGCPLYIEDCADCFTIPDSAVVVGKNQSSVSLIGVLPYFSLSRMASVIIDLQWTQEPFRICANLSHLPDGSLQASALIKRYSPVAAKTVASVVILEYPANNYSEVILKKDVTLDSVAAHSRPINLAATSGPPCGEQVIGPKTGETLWLKQLENAVKDARNTTSTIVPEHLISGKESILGTSLLFSHGKEVFCGSFQLPGTRKIMAAKFDGELEGSVILSQDSSSPELPTEIIYSINRPNGTDVKEKFTSEIVDDGNGTTCDTSTVYNPFKANMTLCSSQSSHECAVGSVSRKSSLFECGFRRHSIVQQLPLSGAFTVAGKSIRLKSTDGNDTIQCAPLITFNEASFYWNVRSNRSLLELGEELERRLSLLPFQHSIDYNRQLLGGSCSTYRITVYDKNERLASILKEFDVEKRKFTSDEPLSCEGEQTADSAAKAAPSAAPSLLLIPFLLVAVYSLQ